MTFRPLPAGLFPHQVTSIEWMQKLYQKNQGGILADDMGLGKTVQVSAFLHTIRARCVLMVMPVTLIGNWQLELAKWYPDLRVFVLHGSKSRQEKAKNMGSSGIILTSYETLGQCADEIFQFKVTEGPREKKRKVDDDEFAPWVDPFANEPLNVGHTCPWDVIVFDEAHRLKNPSTLIGKAAHKVLGRTRIMLTGTPIQNNLEDLWSVMDICAPGLLGNLSRFRLSFAEPIDRGSLKSSTHYEVDLKNVLATQLRELIKPHLVRRTKEEVDLMNGVIKTEVVVWVRPTKIMTDIYHEVLKQSADIRNINSSTDVKLGLEVFRAVNLLKKICNTPMLAHPNAHNWTDLVSKCCKPDEENEEMIGSRVQEGMGDGDPISELETSKSDDDMIIKVIRALGRKKDDLIAQSAKLQVIRDLLPQLINNGHRVVIFSASTKMCDLIIATLLKPSGFRFLRIDGSSSQELREEKIRRFQSSNEIAVFLSSTQVGGVGLTLTGADRVILCDPAWNPATDAQAVDRCYRIGQTKDVVSYRLIVSGMIEEKMFRLQVYKMSISNAALGSSSNHIRYFSKNDIKALFQCDPPETLVTKKRMEEKDGVDVEFARAIEKDMGDCRNKSWYCGNSDFSKLFSSLDEELAEDDFMKGDQDRADVKLLLEDLSKTSAEATQKRERKQQETDAATQQIKDAESKKDELIEKRATAKNKLEELKNEAKSVKREVNENRTYFESVERELAKAEKMLTQRENQCDSCREKLETLQSSAKEVETLYGACQREWVLASRDELFPEDREFKVFVTNVRKLIQKADLCRRKVDDKPQCEKTRSYMDEANSQLEKSIVELVAKKRIPGLKKAHDAFVKAQLKINQAGDKLLQMQKTSGEAQQSLIEAQERRMECVETCDEARGQLKQSRDDLAQVEKELKEAEEEMESLKLQEKSVKNTTAELKNVEKKEKRELNECIKLERDAVKQRKKGEDGLNDLKRKHEEIETAKKGNLHALKAEAYDADQTEKMFKKARKKEEEKKAG